MSKEYEMRPLQKLVTDDYGFFVKKEVMFIEADAVDDLKRYYDMKLSSIRKVTDEMENVITAHHKKNEFAFATQVVNFIEDWQPRINKILEAE